MKKYNLSEIMKNAWMTKKSCKKLSFSECLRRAWTKAKQAVQNAMYYGIKFVDGMEITMDGYTRTLKRWTKNGMDRVYINGGSRRGDGYVDIKNGKSYQSNSLTYTCKMVDAILSMVF